MYEITTASVNDLRDYFATEAVDEAELTRTDLTDYEAGRLHQTSYDVSYNSFAVGAFVTRYGNEDDLYSAAVLYEDLLEKLVDDSRIRTGALGYFLSFAESRANDRHASQAARLQGEFLKMLFQNAIADRADAKVGA